jgi:hypothetical protein
MRTREMCSYTIPCARFPAIENLDLIDFRKFVNRYIPGPQVQYILTMDMSNFIVGFDMAVNIDNVMELMGCYTNGWVAWRHSIVEHIQQRLSYITQLVEIVNSYLEPF